MDTFVLGQPVPLTFECFDTDGALVAPTTAVLTIHLPSGSTTTPTLGNPDPGVFVLDYVPAATGRHVAAFVATGPGAGAVADVFDVIAADLSVVTVADVEDYLGATSWTTADITDALAVERAAQAAVCRIDDYTADLRHALLRRVARNLALRSNHLGVGSMDGDGPAIAPGRDQEVRRYEAPYRRLVVG